MTKIELKQSLQNMTMTKIFKKDIKNMGASIVKWTKKVLWYTKAMIFLVKRL